MDEKPIRWVGAALDDLRAFPAIARREAGYQLHRVQRGLLPTDWKPMTSVASGVHEVRVQVGRQFRVIYVAKFEEAVYVLHAFEKKTQRTRKSDIEVARTRYAIVTESRK